MGKELYDITKQMRAHIIKMLAAAGSGHPGGSLSAVDVVASLYFKHMHVDPENPDWEDRDRFVLSKGHAAPALYAALALKGFFDEEELMPLRQLHSRLQGHPCMFQTPGVDMSTGSLGQGLSVANGMALAGRLDGRDYYVYCLMGDGEIQEGQIWEAAMSAAHYHLDHLIAFVDHNGLQIDGASDEVMSLGDIRAKAEAFGYDVIEVADGNDMKQVLDALHTPPCPGKPRYIILNTTKGKGVSFMEGQVGWHGKAPNAEQAEQALKELEG